MNQTTHESQHRFGLAAVGGYRLLAAWLVALSLFGLLVSVPTTAGAQPRVTLLAAAAATATADPSTPPGGRGVMSGPLVIAVESPKGDQQLHTDRDFLIVGYALDTRANANQGVQGSGIDRVQLWMDIPPDAKPMDDAELGFSDANAATFGTQFANSGFRLRFHPGGFPSGSHNLYIVAHSAVTGQQIAMLAWVSITTEPTGGRRRPPIGDNGSGTPPAATNTPGSGGNVTPTATNTPGSVTNITETPTPQASATSTPTASATLTLTASPTPSITPTATATSTITPTPTATSTPTNTPTPTQTPTLTPTPTNTATATPTPTATPTNVAPVITTSSGALAYTEDAPATAIDVGLTVTDADSPNLVGGSVSITGGFASGEDVFGFSNQSGITGSYNNATGVLTLSGTASVASYQTALRSVTYANTSDNPSTATRTVTFTVDDGSTSNNTGSNTRQVNITAVNDAPVVSTTSGLLTFTEGDAATTIDAGITVSDVDSASLAGATVQITTGCANPEDVLAFVNTATITGTFTAVTCSLALSGSDSVANYQAALRTITYGNTSNNPSTAPRTVTFSANDGSATGTAARGISVLAVDNPPVNSVPSDQTVDEDTDLVFSTGSGNALSMADVDANSGSMQVAVSALNGTITPATGSGATISGSGTSSATISGTLTQVNAALNGLRYRGNLDFNSTRGVETLTMVSNDQGNTGTGGPLSDSDTVAIAVNAVNDPPVALAHSYTAQANMQITGLSGLLSGATDPDTGDSGYTAVLTVGTVSATSPAGGTISNLDASAGTFDFDPPPGVAGNVTFTYTVCDTGNPAPSQCSAPGTVTVSVAGPVIWFVDPAAATNGDGRLSGPFNSLPSGTAATGTSTSQRIFVFSGTTALGAGVSLTGAGTQATAQWLVGQGAIGTNFDTLMGITPPSGTIARPAINGTRPTLRGTVSMQTNTVVRGLNIDVSAGGTRGLTNGTTAAGSVLTVSDVNVTSATGNAVDFSNAQTLNYTTSGASSPNVISSTTGIALNVMNTTIGASGMTFRSISADGASNGILLNGTGSTGGLTVTGSGDSTTGGNNSGGEIQHTTGAAISLTNTLSPSFTNMNIHDIALNGVDGTGVTNFTFNNSKIVNTGTSGAGQFDEHLISFNDGGAFTTATVSGVVNITGNTLTQPRRNGVDLETGNGTISNLTISNNTISGGTTTANILHAILVEAQGSATTNANITTGHIQNNTISGFEFFDTTTTPNIFTGGSGIFVAGGSGNGSNNTTSTLGTSANPIVISSNDVDNVGSNGIAVSFNGQNGDSHFTIQNNGTVVDPMSNMEGLGISVFFGGSGSFSALVDSNAIDNNGPTVNAGSAGIGVQLDDGPAGLANATGTAMITVTNNTVTNPDGSGIRGIVRASNGTLNLKVQNNNVGTPSAANRNAIRVDSGSTNGNTTLCLNMTGNSGPAAIGTDQLVGSGVNAGIGVRKQGTVTTTNFFGINGITANPSNAQVQSFIGGNNPSTDGNSSANGVDIISGSGYMTCSLP